VAGHVVVRITERLGGGEPLRTAYAVAEPNQHRAIALFKLRPDHTADERVEAVVELTQSALDSLGLEPPEGRARPRRMAVSIAAPTLYLFGLNQTTL
jgi:hypothetical protein